MDGELSSAGVLGVQAHLKQCESCEAEHQALRRTVQLVALYGRLEAPIDIRESVMARLREMPSPSPRVAWPSLANLFGPRLAPIPVWARATACACVLAGSIGVGSLMMHGGQNSANLNRPVQLAQDDTARVRESSQLLQALGRDDGYILAADVVDWSR
jgi:anti-sigma factor RsiW